LSRNPASKTFTKSIANGIKFIRENEAEECLQQQNPIAPTTTASNSYRLVATAADNTRFLCSVKTIINNLATNFQQESIQQGI
jgi:hypothetical protein